MLFQEEVYNRCQTKCTAEEFGHWCRYYSKSLEAIGRDSTLVKMAVWLKWPAISLDNRSLASAIEYARALGRTSEESLLFQGDALFGSGQGLCLDLGPVYSESLKEVGRDSGFVDDNPLSLPGLPLPS